MSYGELSWLSRSLEKGARKSDLVKIFGVVSLGDDARTIAIFTEDGTAMAARPDNAGFYRMFESSDGLQCVNPTGELDVMVRDWGAEMVDLAQAS